MRVTITLDDAIAAQAWERAHEAHQTLDQFIEEALRLRLSQAAAPPRRSLEPPTFAGGRLMPGISATSTSDTMELLDGWARHARSPR